MKSCSIAAQTFSRTSLQSPDDCCLNKRTEPYQGMLFNKAADFKTRNKLGVIGKAKLINAFQWELKDAGYTDKFVKLAVEGITAYTSRKAS